MATIRKRGNSYQIRVSVGYDTRGNHKEQSMTWKPEDGMTERQIQKELNRQAVMFEEACMKGFKTSAVKFEELAEEWFNEYAKFNLKSTTYERMKQLTHRVYPAIGHPNNMKTYLLNHMNKIVYPPANKHCQTHFCLAVLVFMFILDSYTYNEKYS